MKGPRAVVRGGGEALPCGSRLNGALWFVSAGRLRVGVVLSVLFFTIIGSAALVLVADHFLFRYGTWSGWTLTPTIAKHDDLNWWQSRIGPLPPPTASGYLLPPASTRGRDGQGGDGCEGANYGQLPSGLAAYRMSTKSPMIRGGVLVSRSSHVWRAGVQLPGGMAVERIYIGRPGAPPPHPTLGGWDWRILPVALVLNTLYAAGPVCILVTLLAWEAAGVYRRIRGTRRRTRGRCPDCGYVLLTGQSVCPECGYEERGSER